ncbi:MAG: hypothetical protein WCG81_11780 [Candidatus Angelobacter sp.]
MEHQPFPPNSTKPPQSKFPWPLVALGVAAALLIVTFWLIPRTNKASTVINTVDQPTAQLRISNVRISPQEANGVANVDVFGDAMNVGASPVTQAIVSATFHDKNGNSILVQQQPIQRADTKDGKVEEAKALSEEPLKPGQTAPFRVSYSQIPATWDRKAPELSVLQITVPK